MPQMPGGFGRQFTRLAPDLIGRPLFFDDARWNPRIVCLYILLKKRTPTQFV
jgi:hypothetical protein